MEDKLDIDSKMMAVSALTAKLVHEYGVLQRGQGNEGKCLVL